ncbi:MAG: hypothetical protein QM756_02975 [Polyangiaceae bacterium]
MNTKLLIDAIVHQTTVLIAQLSTAAGIRAPLAHIADQVFLELSREIEAQGVSRKVAADMFGMAIRTYQKKVQRVTESVSVRDRTLWQAALEHLEAVESTTRREILERFQRDDPVVVGSVLNDLVSSGLVYKTGSGDSAIFGITRERDRARALREQQRESLAPLVWLLVYRSGGSTVSALAEQLQVEPEALQEALSHLESQGQVQASHEAEEVVYRAAAFVVPVGAEHGWEAAVFDHFQTVVRAISSKVRQGNARSAHDNVTGGATLSFDVHPAHPHREEVLGLLKHVRTHVNEVWTKVQAHNEQHAVPEHEKLEVSFYFGQCVTAADEE